MIFISTHVTVCVCMSKSSYDTYRAARSFPILSVSRLLISLSDYDITTSHILKPSSEPSYVILSALSTSPLLKDQLDVFLVNISTRFNYWFYWFNRYFNGIVYFIFSLFMLFPDEIQTNFVEFFCCLVLCGSFISLAYSSNISPALTVFLILLPSILYIINRSIAKYLSQETPEMMLQRFRMEIDKKKRLLSRIKASEDPMNASVIWKDLINVDHTIENSDYYKKIPKIVNPLKSPQKDKEVTIIPPLPSISNIQEILTKSVSPEEGRKHKSSYQLKLERVAKVKTPPKSKIRPIYLEEYTAEEHHVNLTAKKLKKMKKNTKKYNAASMQSFNDATLSNSTNSGSNMRQNDKKISLYLPLKEYNLSSADSVLNQAKVTSKSTARSQVATSQLNYYVHDVNHAKSTSDSDRQSFPVNEQFPTWH